MAPGTHVRRPHHGTEKDNPLYRVKPREGFGNVLGGESELALSPQHKFVLFRDLVAGWRSGVIENIFELPIQGLFRQAGNV